MTIVNNIGLPTWTLLRDKRINLKCFHQTTKKTKVTMWCDGYIN